MPKWLLRVLVLALFLASLPLLLVEGLYRHGLRRVGALPPKPVVSLSESQQRFIWAAEEDGPFEVKPFAYPCNQILSFWRTSRTSLKVVRSSGGHHLAVAAARNWASHVGLGRGRTRDWHLGTWALSMWLLRHWSAAELTQAYSETAYFGHHATGLTDAARRYFGKAQEELSVAELALLLGLPQAPSRYNPWRDPKAALRQRDHVLHRFAQTGILSPEEANAAMGAPLGVLPIDAPAERGE